MKYVGSLNGGGSTDTLDYSANGGGAISVNLTTGKATSIDSTFSNITTLKGSKRTLRTHRVRKYQLRFFSGGIANAQPPG